MMERTGWPGKRWSHHRMSPDRDPLIRQCAPSGLMCTFTTSRLTNATQTHPARVLVEVLHQRLLWRLADIVEGNVAVAVSLPIIHLIT